MAFAVGGPCYLGVLPDLKYVDEPLSTETSKKNRMVPCGRVNLVQKFFLKHYRLQCF